MDSPQARKELGLKLRKVREEKNLTQAQLAKKAHINANYYACVERGEENVSSGKLSNIIEALGVKSSEISPY